ncbi:hypothetical protein ACOME3_001642 [Neoechinorhynchus agilis]
MIAVFIILSIAADHAVSIHYESIGVVRGKIIGSGILPKDAVVELRLDDISRLENGPETIAHETIYGPPRFPFTFDLAYETESINENNRYAVGVRIMDPKINNKLIYVNHVQVRTLSSGKLDSNLLIPLIKLDPRNID